MQLSISESVSKKVSSGILNPTLYLEMFWFLIFIYVIVFVSW